MGHELSVAQAASVFPVIATAVRLAAKRVALQGIETGWDDEAYRENFGPDDQDGSSPAPLSCAARRAITLLRRSLPSRPF
jgi:hypothetical protein